MYLLETVKNTSVYGMQAKKYLPPKNELIHPVHRIGPDNTLRLMQPEYAFKKNIFLRGTFSYVKWFFLVKTSQCIHKSFKNTAVENSYWKRKVQKITKNIQNWRVFEWKKFFWPLSANFIETFPRDKSSKLLYETSSCNYLFF